jgi:TolA-binding protein
LKKALVIVLLIGFGIKYGLSYLESDKFQQFADEQKAPWTCQVNNLVGNFYVTMSAWETALKFFKPVLKRCEKTDYAEEAEFKIARCLEGLGRRAEAIMKYRQYAEKYKNSRRAQIARNSADILQGL